MGKQKEMKETVKRKAGPSTAATSVISIRMPSELLTALRKKSAEETVRLDQRVSINQLVVDILMEAMRAYLNGGNR